MLSCRYVRVHICTGVDACIHVAYLAEGELPLQLVDRRIRPSGQLHALATCRAQSPNMSPQGHEPRRLNRLDSIVTCVGDRVSNLEFE